MNLAKVTVVVGALALIYTWIGYPLVLCVLRRFFQRAVVRRSLGAPSVSIIIAVHNEEDKLVAKLTDCLTVDYPAEKMEILVVSDDSTDRSELIVREFSARDPRIHLVSGTDRLGKSGAQNLGAARAEGDILFFTDADTRMPAGTINTLLENFVDPAIGLVTADVHFTKPGNPVADGQGTYWRFELFVRRLQSELGILATGSGQALMMRRELYRPIPQIYGDDCILPLDVRLQGYRVIQDSRVKVFDSMPNSIHGELRARIRMTARNWCGTWSRPAVLNPFRFPLTSWSLISHKLLRWLTPFFMGLLFVSNLTLSIRGDWVCLCAAQTIFYVGAFVGWLRARDGASAWLLDYPFSFCLANVGFLLGMLKVLRRQKIIAY